MGLAKLRGNREFRILTMSNNWREKKGAIQKTREQKRAKHLESVKDISSFFQIKKTYKKH